MADDNTQQQKSSAGAEIRQQLGLDKSFSQRVRASEKAARLRERDINQYGNPNELGIRKVFGAKVASGLERELTNVFGTRIGEALRSSRRAEPGQKYKEFKSSLMGSFASSLGRSGVIGQFLANKLREQREFAEDPTEEYQKIRENFEIVSGDMFNINARFKAIEDKLEDSDQSVSRIVQEQLKPINVRLDDTRKDLDQLKTQFNEFENTTFTRFQSTVTKDIVDLKGKVGKLLATSQHIQSSLQMMSEQQSGQPQSQPPSLLQTAAAGARGPAAAGAGRSALRGSLRYLKPLGRFAGVAGVGYAMYEALDSIGQMNQQRDKDIGITPGMSQEEISAIKKQANINRRKSAYSQLSEQTKQLKQQVATQPAQRARARGLFGLGGFPQTDQPTIKYQPPSFDQYRQEREKSRFLQYGQLPEGFEFLPGNMGRLGQPEAVAARGAMPLGGYGEVAGVPGMPRGGYAGGGGNAAGTTAGPVANVGKESTSTGGGALPNMPSLDPTKFVAGGIDRTKLYDQLMNDPALRLRLFALSHREMGDPEGRADIMNTVMNRAMGRSGGNLRKELFDLAHYFGPHNRDPSKTYRLEKEIAGNPALYKQYEQSMMRLLYGEERVKGAYHQEGTPGYKERRMREFPQGHVGRGGEYYYNKPFEMDPSKLPRLSPERLEQLRKDPRFSGAIPAPGQPPGQPQAPGTTTTGPRDIRIPNPNQLPGGQSAQQQKESFKGSVTHMTPLTLEELKAGKDPRNASYGYHTAITASGEIHALRDYETRPNQMEPATQGGVANPVRTGAAHLSNQSAHGVAFLGTPKDLQNPKVKEAFINYYANLVAKGILPRQYSEGQLPAYGHGQIQSSGRRPFMNRGATGDKAEGADTAALINENWQQILRRADSLQQATPAAIAAQPAQQQQTGPVAQLGQQAQQGGFATPSPNLRNQRGWITSQSDTNWNQCVALSRAFNPGVGAASTWKVDPSIPIVPGSMVASTQYGRGPHPGGWPGMGYHTGIAITSPDKNGNFLILDQGARMQARVRQVNVNSTSLFGGQAGVVKGTKPSLAALHTALAMAPDKLKPQVREAIEKAQVPGQPTALTPEQEKAAGVSNQAVAQRVVNDAAQQVATLSPQQREKIVSEVAAQHGVSEDAIRNRLAMQTEQEKKASEGAVDLATPVPPVAGADLGGYTPEQVQGTTPAEPRFTIPTAQEREALGLEGVPPVPSEGPQIPEVPGIGPRQEPLPPELKPIPPPAPPDMADTGGYSPEQTATVAAQQEIAKQQEAATTTQPQAPAQTAGDASGGSPQFPRHQPESQRPSAGDGGKGSYGRCFV